MENSSVKEINSEEKIVKEIKHLVPLFLLTNVSDKRIAEITGISASNVGRRLTDKERIERIFDKETISEIFQNGLRGFLPTNGAEIYEEIMKRRQENIQNAKIIGSELSKVNNYNNSLKLRLDVFYGDEDKQITLLNQLALTFRAKSPLLAELFGYDEHELVKKMLEYSGNAYRGIKYLLEHDFYDQEKAKEKILDFYRELLTSKKERDNKKYYNLLTQISDIKTKELAKNHESGDLLSDEDIETILNYELKYAVTQRELCNIFGIDRNNFFKRIKPILDSNPELKNRYESLANYKENTYFNGR